MTGDFNADIAAPEGNWRAENIATDIATAGLEDMGTKLLHRLHHEVGFGAVEKCDAAAVSARRIRRNDAIAGRPAGVDSLREFCLLEDSQVHVGLGHPPECHFQPPLSAVTDVVGAESNWHLPTRRPPGSVAHVLPTVPKFFPSPFARLPHPGRRRSCLLSLLARPHRYPRRYRSRPPVLIPPSAVHRGNPCSAL